MKIYRGVSYNIITQWFNANPNMVEFYKKNKMTNHGGIDFGVPTGSPLYYDCPIDGYVLNTEIDNSGGLGINIITESEEGIYKHRYWHLKKFCVKAGDKVKMGDFLGFTNNTGASTGPHLHRDVKEMFKDEFGNMYVKNQDNGTFGTINIDNWLDNRFVLDMVGKTQRTRSLLITIINLLKR